MATLADARCVVAAAIAALACASEDAPPAPPVHSLQLHLHGSFSEGLGSIASHAHEAAEVGADVLWWSDHDWRIASYRHASRFGFEAEREPLDAGEDWRARERRETHGSKGFRFEDAPDASAALEGGRAFAGERCLRVEVRGQDEAFRDHAGRFEASRGRAKRPLAAGVALDVAIRADALGPDARAFVDVALSEHYLEADAPPTPLRVRYVVGGPAGEARREGPVYVVPLAAAPGGWRRYTLELTRDAQRGFPEIDGRDNALRQLALGVSARLGAHAAACFDALEIRQQTRGAASYARQRELLAAQAERDPRVRHLQGVEISYHSPHLNEIGLAPALPDYDALHAALGAGGAPRRASRGRSPKRFAIVEQLVADAHARGSLVAYNHPFGIAMPGESDETRDPEPLLRRLLEARAYGADLIEVGYRNRGGATLADHLALWDRLTEEGLALVGIGTSDSHGGDDGRWRGGPNNFVTWVHAPSADAADLLAGLAAGRAFFGDLVRFDGALDLATEAGARMGQIVVGADADPVVRIQVWGTQRGDVVHVIEGGRPEVRFVTGGAYFEIRHTLALPHGADGSVRIELRDAAGRPRALGNPIVFRGKRPPAARPERLFEPPG